MNAIEYNTFADTLTKRHGCPQHIAFMKLLADLTVDRPPMLRRDLGPNLNAVHCSNEFASDPSVPLPWNETKG